MVNAYKNQPDVKPVTEIDFAKIDYSKLASSLNLINSNYYLYY